MDSKLSFNEHAKMTAEKASKVAKNLKYPATPQLPQKTETSCQCRPLNTAIWSPDLGR